MCSSLRRHPCCVYLPFVPASSSSSSSSSFLRETLKPLTFRGKHEASSSQRAIRPQQTGSGVKRAAEHEAESAELQSVVVPPCRVKEERRKPSEKLGRVCESENPPRRQLELFTKELSPCDVLRHLQTPLAAPRSPFLPSFSSNQIAVSGARSHRALKPLSNPPHSECYG